jgi:hypothetical protein
MAILVPLSLHKLLTHNVIVKNGTFMHFASFLHIATCISPLSDGLATTANGTEESANWTSTTDLTEFRTDRKRTFSARLLFTTMAVYGKAATEMIVAREHCQWPADYYSQQITYIGTKHVFYVSHCDRFRDR